MKHIVFKNFIATVLLFFTSLMLSGCEKNILVYDYRLQIGVFGGSVSSSGESEIAKNIWRKSINANIVSCGVGGAGFSSMTNNNIPSQIRDAQPFDIYILWASTNDVTKSTVGEIDFEDEETQDGGILKAISTIKQKNSKALILFFTSLPRFDEDKFYQKIPYFVEDQIAICEKKHIPCLDQYHLCGFDKNNYKPYYLMDRMHLNDDGYRKIAYLQAEFIREHIRNYKKQF